MDDDIDFARNLSKDAQQYEIFLVHKTNYREMEESLPNLIGKIACVILDLKCLIEPDSPAPREEFLMKALRFLDQKYSHLPKFVLTGDSAGYDFVKTYSPNEKIYKKASNEIATLFQEIYKLDVEQIKIRSKYSTIFTVLDRGFLPEAVDGQLIDLLNKQENENYGTILDNLARIRRIQESVFQTINSENNKIIPDYLMQDDGNIHFGDIHRHLTGNPNHINHKPRPTTEVFYSTPVADFSKMVYNVTSDHGSHTPYEQPMYKPTKYTVIACTNALLDLILWFGKTI